MIMKFKNLIKNLTFIFVIALTFLLSGCEKDLYEDNLQNNLRSVTMKDFSIKDLKSDKAFLRNKIEEIKQHSFKRDKNNKIVYDSINNFYFDDENGIFIDDGVNHSYVFTIDKNIDENIEKLVFSSNPDGTYKTLIAKYDFSAQELATLSK